MMVVGVAANAVQSEQRGCEAGSRSRENLAWFCSESDNTIGEQPQAGVDLRGKVQPRWRRGRDKAVVY